MSSPIGGLGSSGASLSGVQTPLASAASPGASAGSTGQGQASASGPSSMLGGSGLASALGGTGQSTSTGGSTGSTGGSTQSLAGTDTFLKLLVAQLRNQDPTSPMDDQAFVTELAQFNTVEQMINLQDKISAQVTAQQATEGVALLGKTVTYKVPSLTGGPTTSAQGQVSGVNMGQNGVQLQIGTQAVDLSNVISVGSQTASPAGG